MSTWLGDELSFFFLGVSVLDLGPNSSSPGL